MKRWKNYVLYLAVLPVILLISPSGWTMQQVSEIPAGATAKTLDGKIVSIGDYKGKLLFLNMWKTDCLPCLVEIPILNRLQKEYASKDFTVIGISVDRGKEDLVNTIVKKAKINYPVWLSYDQPISQYVNYPYTPFLLVIGPDGSVLGHFLGKIPTYQDAVGFIDQARAIMAEREALK